MCGFGFFENMVIFMMWTHMIFLGCIRTVKKVNSSFITCCLGGFSSLFVSPLAKFTLLDIYLILMKNRCIAVFRLNKPNGLKSTTFSISTRYTFRFHRWSYFWGLFFNKEKDFYFCTNGCVCHHHMTQYSRI